MTSIAESTVGFAPDEIDTAAPTRAARLKWVVAVDDALPAGLAVNAAICVAAATARAVPGLLGPDGADRGGTVHPGLPWAGCTVLAASTEQLRTLRDKASGTLGTYVADMPGLAQQTRVYDEYLARLRDVPGSELGYLAVGIVGPRNRVDKLVRRLPLLP
ncbi:hypothetical protein Athai_09240 [Actinocatenispora thailandica]|uniref:DUF2000 domain-containing protein n=1 Tax=Actinocatenispora thailandica TaxID=227318 RepID=A0A7R7DL04_9ACTN|nr:DUF2000 domain-containing protein [Actinocatenispora thailandica]BCJ33421.1 hypothetical protein Athai_09240 [Actinocatenispora thailandica]